LALNSRLLRTILKSVFIFYFLFVRYPVLVIIRILSLGIKRLRQRAIFEKSNNLKVDLDSSHASHCFHVSSQGELEQVYALIEKALRENNLENIEIVYTSSSVRKNVIALASLYPNRVRYFALGLLSFNPFSFYALSQKITADTVLMCRYDFFPELLFLSFSKRLILLNARVQNKGRLYFKVLKLFNFIVSSSDKDEALLKSEGLDVYGVADFRAMRISDRQVASVSCFDFKNFKKACKSWEGKVFCFGSSWKSDLEEIKFKNYFSNENLYFFFPHQLNDLSIIEHLKYLPSNSKVIKVLDRYDLVSDIENGARVFIVSHMGVLCDLYPYFDLVYIGGGFGKSIHSVLEPYVSGALVFCGPEVNRSSEFDFITSREPKKLKKVQSSLDMESFFCQNISFVRRGEDRLEHIKSFKNEHEVLVKKVLGFNE
jgi:3-deoxy-D-manno-octulosonic-acid transferase